MWNFFGFFTKVTNSPMSLFNKFTKRIYISPTLFASENIFLSKCCYWNILILIWAIWLYRSCKYKFRFILQLLRFWKYISSMSYISFITIKFFHLILNFNFLLLFINIFLILLCLISRFIHLILLIKHIRS